MIEDEWQAKIVREVAGVELEMAAINIFQKKEMEELVLKHVAKTIKKKSQDLYGKKRPSLLKSTNPGEMTKLTDVELDRELS